MYLIQRWTASYCLVIGAVVTMTSGCASDEDPLVTSEDALSVNSELRQKDRAQAKGHDESDEHPSRHHHRDNSNAPSEDETCPAACTPRTCTTVSPTNALITDWKDVSSTGLFVDGDHYRQRDANWYEEFFGGPYVYPAVDPCSSAPAPAYPLAQTTDHGWHVQGVVGAWSGFGLWFGPCSVDLSAYRGVTFSIWGNVGTTSHLRFEVLTGQNTKASACLPNVGTCDAALYSCKNPMQRIAVPSEHGQAITVLWSDLLGGVPMNQVDPSQILGLHFGFEREEWGDKITPPFPVDVHVGTVTLVP